MEGSRNKAHNVTWLSLERREVLTRAHTGESRFSANGNKPAHAPGDPEAITQAEAGGARGCRGGGVQWWEDPFGKMQTFRRRSLQATCPPRAEQMESTERRVSCRHNTCPLTAGNGRGLREMKAQLAPAMAFDPCLPSGSPGFCFKV